ncbi:MAG: hypothetical protein OXI67_09250 [Candidatus Poribacteria bacterium]|nr:hypothetical protein [Candidatus Poribacteria bacterium]
MSMLKDTLKYLMIGGFALIVVFGIITLVSSQIQKKNRAVENHAHPHGAVREGSTPRQNSWQKITSKFKRKPKPSHSHGHLDLGPPPPPMEYPRDLKERLDKVKADNNSYFTNPNFFQEVYEAVSDGRDMETTIEILKKYNIYTDVVLEHMDSYEAFIYILESAPVDYTGTATKYGERVISEDPSSAEALEAGILLGGEDDLRAVLKYHPNSPLALFKLGNLLLFERPEEAIVHLKKATQLGKLGDFSNSLDTGDRMLGIAYQYLGDYKTAWVHLKRAQALAVDPNHPRIRGHLAAIERGDPTILPIQREPASDAIGQDTAEKHPLLDDTPAPPPQGFVDTPAADALPTSPIPSPPEPEGIPPVDGDREAAESQAFLDMFREDEAFNRRLAEDELFREAYFKEVDAFIKWAEALMNEKPKNANDFLQQELKRHLSGKKTNFDPDRITRGYEMMNKYGREDGLKHLHKRDPHLAKEIEAMQKQDRNAPQTPTRRK